jgi:hypothetical protein
MSSTSSEFVGRTIHEESVATLNNPGPAWSAWLLGACKKKYPETDYTLIAFFQHASSIDEKTEGREIGENRVGKSYGRNGFELQNEVNHLATGIIRVHGTDQEISLSVPAGKQRDQYKNTREE